MPTINGTPDNDTLTGTSEPDIINGLAGDDQLSGLEGDDQLDGGAGADTMNGGPGDDLFLVDNRLDQLVETTNQFQGGFNDELVTSVNYTLGAGVGIEVLRAAGGTAPLFIRGNDIAQTLYGNAGDNLLIGGGGIRFEGIFSIGDTFVGGAGNDTYVVAQSVDRIVEASGEGEDAVLALGSFSLGLGVEVETMVAAEGTQPINLFGNELAQSIYGNAGNNLIGSGGGADYLVGGAGHDLYFVSALATIAENPGEGDDLVRTTNASFVLPANVEDLQASWSDFRGTTDPLSLTGNELDNEIVGNLGDNLLRGGDGNDTLLGTHDLAPDGNEAPDGNDILNGGAGADHMDGRQGNDLYIVDNAGDTVVERTGDGDDVVSTFVSYALPEGFGGFIETLAAQDSAGAITLQGNGNSNSIYGNAAANVLISNGGADYLVGGGGNDTYFLNGMFNSEERIAESAGGGSDIVYAGHDYILTAGAEVEILSAAAQAATGALNLTGNELANHVIGNDGANTLEGGLGRDTFSGRAGADLFVFAAIGEDHADQIHDFAPGVDRIGLRSSAFAGLPEGALGPDSFRAGTSAQDSSDRIIYDSATGRLWFDPDGSGAAQQTIFGYVSPATALSASDFQVLGSSAEAQRKTGSSATAAMAGAVAAAGMAALPADPRTDGEAGPALAAPVHPGGGGRAAAAVALGSDSRDAPDHAAIAPPMARAHPQAESAAASGPAGHGARAELDAAAAAAPAGFDGAAGTAVPAAMAEAIPFAATAVAMPAAAQLHAPAAADAVPAQQLGLVLAEALAGGGGDALDALLDGLGSAGHGPAPAPAAVAAAATPAALAPGPIEALALEALLLHPDSPPVA